MHRWWVILAALLVVAGSIALLSTGIVTTPQDKRMVGDSAEAVGIVTAADFGRGPTEMVVATTTGQRLDPARIATIAASVSAAYRGAEGVAAIDPAFPGQDGRSVVIPVQLRARHTPADTTLPEPSDAVVGMLAVTQRLAGEHPDLTISQVGPGSTRRGIDASFGADMQRAELISQPITLLVLLIAFGAVVAAGVPLLLGLGSVVVALGLTAAASQHLVTVDPTAQSLILLIGLAVGVDYALFVLRRAREERAKGASMLDSIALAGASAGRAVIISGLTVMVAMAGMLVAGGLFTSLAIGTLIVVGVAVLASATVLPAVLAILGDRVEALRLPFSRRRAARRGSEDSAWGRLAGRVSRRPWRWGLVSALVLVALAVPALNMKTALGGLEMLPADTPIVKAYRQLEAAVPTDGTGVQVVVSAPATAVDRVRAALQQAGAQAAGWPDVTQIAPAPRVSADRTVSVLTIGASVDVSDPRLPQLVARTRAEVVPAVTAALADVPRVAVHVGGDAAGTDLTAWMDQRLPWVVGFVLVLTLLVMALSFGSPWLAASTVALNLLSAGAAYGVMTAVFQGTWAQGLLAFTSTGSIAAWLPMLLFVVLFGLSMDYHIFVTSRVREARDAGADSAQAVRLGVARSAGVVTSAAAVMVAVFSVFGTLSMLEMKQLGVGLAVAVLLDATLVRGVLLPAVLTLLGDRAHTGPRWLPRLHH